MIILLVVVFLDSRLRGNDGGVRGNDGGVRGNDGGVCGNDGGACGNDGGVCGNDELWGEYCGGVRGGDIYGRDACIAIWNGELLMIGDYYEC